MIKYSLFALLLLLAVAPGCIQFQYMELGQVTAPAAPAPRENRTPEKKPVEVQPDPPVTPSHPTAPVVSLPRR